MIHKNNGKNQKYLVKTCIIPFAQDTLYIYIECISQLSPTMHRLYQLSHNIGWNLNRLVSALPVHNSLQHSLLLLKSLKVNKDYKVDLNLKYRISANSSFFRFKYICRYFHVDSAITLLLCSICCRNYLRAETIQGLKLFAEIR